MQRVSACGIAVALLSDRYRFTGLLSDQNRFACNVVALLSDRYRFTRLLSDQDRFATDF